MNRFTRFQRKLLTINICLLLFSCLMLGLRQNSISNAGQTAWTYIKYGLIDYPLQSLGSIFRDMANLWHAHDDAKYLNEQLAQQRSYQTLYEEERNKNEELEKLIDLKGTLPDANIISCAVLSRNSSAWMQTITISAGTKEGVVENMLVATSEGAIGLVEKAGSHTSTVRLLTSGDLVNDIAVKMSLEDGTTIEGVLQSYDTERNAYCVSLFDNDATVTSGQRVATSGKGGNYPSGIYVGTVTEIVMNDDAIISTVYVRPASNIMSFNYCVVIGNEEKGS